MSGTDQEVEGHIPGKDPLWNQSFYYSFFDPTTRIGGLIRIGLMENRGEANSWFIIFRDELPLYTRTNINLPYTTERPLTGIDIAGMKVQVLDPLRETRLTFSDTDFAVELVWSELSPMVDCLELGRGSLGAFGSEYLNVHWEGTSRILGHINVRGERIEVNAQGFRDISAGPRNWGAIRHYTMAWPIFDNGIAFAGAHGITSDGQSAYLKMVYDGRQWGRVKQMEDHTEFSSHTPFVVDRGRWTFVDENDVARHFTATKSIFRWLFPINGFVLCEQMMEWELDDGSKGYGLYETGYRLPWQPLPPI
jgi:hypothetical protein